MKDYTDTPRSAWERRKVAVLASMPAAVKTHTIPWQVIVIRTFAAAMSPATQTPGDEPGECVCTSSK